MSLSRPTELLLTIREWQLAEREKSAIDAERLAPAFTPFEFIDTRENGLSKVIAWLLDPAGSHAQGSRFLLELMNWLGLDESWLGLANCARVRTEVMTQFGPSAGRIDILAVCGSRALAIENKPFAGDQILQIERYLKDMEERWGTSQCLLYLSGDGEGPSEKSISFEKREREEAAGRLIVRGYPALLEWLEACRGACRAQSVALMLDGLKTHVEKAFMGIEDSQSAFSLAQNVAASRDTLEAALLLFEVQKQLYSSLLELLVEQVSAASAKRGWFVTESDLSEQRYSMLVLGFSPDAPVHFGLSFDVSNYRYLIYGMVSEDAEPVSSKLSSAVRDVVGDANETDWWPVYRLASENDAFFPLPKDPGHDFWLKIHSGELAKWLIAYVEAVETQLKSKGLLKLAGGR